MEIERADSQNNRHRIDSRRQLINHRVLRLVVAFGVGLALSLYAFQRVTDPRPGMQRAQEEAVVTAARSILRTYVQNGEELQIVDPLAPDRKVGKVYVYPAEAGWEVSGHYRRHDADQWHPYLMKLDPMTSLIELSVKDDDERVQQKALNDPKLTAVP